MLGNRRRKILGLGTPRCTGPGLERVKVHCILPVLRVLFGTTVSFRHNLRKVVKKPQKPLQTPDSGGE